MKPTLLLAVLSGCLAPTDDALSCADKCDGQDLETDFDKIAVFANDQGIPTHAARQLPSGRWSSKLGELEDIEHDLRDLEGQA